MLSLEVESDLLVEALSKRIEYNIVVIATCFIISLRKSLES